VTEGAGRNQRYRRPESVLVVVYTRALECLMLERTEPRGFWQSVTGTLDWDETPGAAAAREVLEETGLAPAGLRAAGVTQRFPILPAWRARYAPEVTENLEHLWYLELPERCPIVVDPAEHSEFRWLALEAAIEMASSWTNREGLARLRDPGPGK